MADDDEIPADMRVRVGVRVRPPGKADGECRDNIIRMEDGRTYVDQGSKTKTFNYDYQFDQNSTQDDVWNQIGAQMLDDAWNGFNSTVFAYGQTGSGKTHSMMGKLNDPSLEGLLPRMVRNLFCKIEDEMSGDPTLYVKVQMSYLEIYNEKLHDLLQKGAPPAEQVQKGTAQLNDLVLKEDKKKKQFVADGLSLHSCPNADRVFKLIKQANMYRKQAETGSNDFSSRSHSVFTVYITETHDPPNPSLRDRMSKVTIVDLAGSERQSKTDSSGDRLKEAENINKSLLTLGRCLNSFSDKTSKHTPIRDSALTRLLSDIFGGNSKTIMLATVSPTSFNLTESLSTLQYAYNAKKIMHKAKVNNLGKQVEIQELKDQVKLLGKTLIEELEKAAKEKDKIERELREVRRERDDARSGLSGGGDASGEIAQLQAEVERLRHDNMRLRDELTRQPPPMIKGVGEDSDDDDEYEGVRKELLSALGGTNSLYSAPFGGGSDNTDPYRLHPESPMYTARDGQAVPVAAPASTSEIRSYIGHAAAVYCCAFSPSGEKMVSASRDRTLKLWNVKNGTEVFTMRGHHGFVLSCAFSPFGNDFASASDDKTLRIWDTKTGKRVVTMRGHTDKVYCCTYSPNGEEVASASCDRSIKIWKSQKGEKLKTLRGHQSAVFSVAFAHDGRRLVSASDDRTLKVWDVAQGAELQTYTGHTGTVWSCRFAPNDEHILSSSMDGSIKLWDVETGFSVRTYRGHSAPVHHAIFCKNGEKIVSASRDRTLKIWETETGKVLSTLIGHTNTVYHCCVFNNLILSCSSDDILKVWHKENLQMDESQSPFGQGGSMSQHSSFSQHQSFQSNSGHSSFSNYGQQQQQMQQQPGGYGSPMASQGMGMPNQFGGIQQMPMQQMQQQYQMQGPSMPPPAYGNGQ